MSVLLLYLPIDELEKKEIVFDESDRVSNEDRIPRTISLIEFNGPFFFFFSRNGRLMSRSIFNSIHRLVNGNETHDFFIRTDPVFPAGARDSRRTFVKSLCCVPFYAKRKRYTT